MVDADTGATMVDADTGEATADTGGGGDGDGMDDDPGDGGRGTDGYRGCVRKVMTRLAMAMGSPSGAGE